MKEKAEFYSEKTIAEEYEHWRFGGRSGAYVNARETGAVRKLLEGEKGPCLDIACGTGRYSVLLKKLGPTVSSDYSGEMLRIARGKGDYLVRCDALSLPFRDDAFKTIVIGRFLQHQRDMRPVLNEAARVSSEGGCMIFDFLTFSPRNFSGGRKRVFRHNCREIMSWAGPLGITREEKDSCFILPPSLYRFLPFFCVRVLDLLERILPTKLRLRKFWKMRITFRPS